MEWGYGGNLKLKWAGSKSRSGSPSETEKSAGRERGRKGKAKMGPVKKLWIEMVRVQSHNWYGSAESQLVWKAGQQVCEAMRQGFGACQKTSLSEDGLAFS